MAIHRIAFKVFDDVICELRKHAATHSATNVMMNSVADKVQREKNEAEKFANVAAKLARHAKYSGNKMLPSDTLLIVGIAPCVFCEYNGSDFYQVGSHNVICPWVEVGGLTERGTMLMLVYGDPEWITRSSKL